MCHRASAQTAWQCACGYEFGQDLEKVLALLRDQQINARIGLAVLLVLDTAAVAGVIYLALRGVILVAGLGFAVLIGWTVRAARKLLITRASLRQLAGWHRALPRAVVRER